MIKDLFEHFLFFQGAQDLCLFLLIFVNSLKFVKFVSIEDLLKRNEIFEVTINYFWMNLKDQVQTLMYPQSAFE